MRKLTAIFIAMLSLLTSCRKAEQGESLTDANLHATVLEDITHRVIVPTYADMHTYAVRLKADLELLSTAQTTAHLSAARQDWRDVRSAWEMSEGFLFGPVSVENIDPRIDTWPIDFARIDSVLSAGENFTPEYIFGLEESLKGFHPMEYLLWGNDGNKAVEHFTSRELEYLIALAGDLVSLSEQLNTSWSDHYAQAFTQAGAGSTIYPSRRAAYEEVLAAMSGICDEVANGKIYEPLIQQDASLEESPFADNSMTDFYHNILSVRNMYYGMYSGDGKGLEDLIRSQNLSMDAEIKLRIDASLNALNNVTVPFGEAIFTQQNQLHQATDAINSLGEYLDESVLPFVQTIVVD